MMDCIRGRGMKQKVAFRTDGNKTIGMGHVTRCMSIAQALRQLEVESVFILSDGSSCELLNKNGFAAHVLNINYKDIDSDVELVRDFAGCQDIKCILVDSYYASDYYLESLMGFAHVACIDGLYKYEAGVSLVINYNAAASYDYYRKKYDGKDTGLLIGNDFVPLKPSYWNTDVIEENSTRNRLLITTGATDSLNICGQLLDCLEEAEILSMLEVTIVIGSFFKSKDELESRWAKHSNVDFIKNCTDLMPLMKKTDIAVSAAGTTAYELVRMEIPTILFAMVDNQLTAAALKDRVIWAGDIRETKESNEISIEKVRSIVSDVKLLYEDAIEYHNAKSRCRKYIDGQGALRIAREIMKLVE